MADISISHDDLSPVGVEVDYDYAEGGRRARYSVFVFDEEVFQSEWEDRPYGLDPEDLEKEWKGKWQSFQVAQFKGWLKAQPVPQCPFTQSHTRAWCGYEGCRES